MNLLLAISIACGLAGSAAFRGFFPLILASLTGIIDYPPALEWLSSTPVLLILLVLMGGEFLLQHFPGVSFFHSSVYTAVKVIIGGILFSSALRIAPLIGMILGGLITGFFIFSRLALQPLVEEEVYQFHHLEYDTVENLAGIVLTILTIVIPWLSLIILGVLSYGVIRIEQNIS